jgi:hypothetical protein
MAMAESRRRDDVLAGGPGHALLFLNQPVDGKLSLPEHPASIGTAGGRSRLASGDLNSDARADFIAVNETGIHRFFGDGRGGFRRFPDGAFALGSANGLPAITDQRSPSRRRGCGSTTRGAG